ncbi:T9SS type A sorting domain-containing protein [Xanthocytophaga flava]|uniref:T9SS type A sorting domain-containing protein n=1 Tax=Xanthocytophaga flava TaxID=3048013 RepID=UPI0028D0DBF1|nr:T9SS type A sorting domain-containing protein [Xanthocytophaga flavus]MDJ1467607.1 T9SS type A sorting domain-containing protein [Xanthocytophaga flavus]
MKQLLQIFVILIWLSYSTVSAQTYTPDSTFTPLLTKEYTTSVRSIMLQPDQKILISGFFTYLNDIPVKELIRLDANGSIDNTFQLAKEIEGYQSMQLRQDGKIVLTDILRDEPSQPLLQFHILNSDGSLNSTYKTTIPCNFITGKSFAIQKDNKMLVGTHTYYKSSYRAKLNRFLPDGKIDPSFTIANINFIYINEIYIQADEKIIIVGDIDYPDSENVSRIHLIRLNKDGSVDATFKTNDAIGDQVATIALQNDGKMLFGYYGSLIRLEADGSIDYTFKAENENNTSFNVSAIAIQSDNRIIASIWRPISNSVGYGSGQIVRFMPDGKLDKSFEVSSGSQYAIPIVVQQSNGDILTGGTSLSYNGTIQTGLVRLKGTDGKIDSSFPFKTERDGLIETINQQSDGKVLVGGSFATANNKAQFALTRLLPDGQVDINFKARKELDGTSSSNEERISKIVVQSDDKIWVGGYFSTFNGENTTSLIRLNPDGSTDATFQLSDSRYNLSDIAIQPDGKILISSRSNGWDSTKFLLRLLPDGTLDPAFKGGSTVKKAVERIVLQEDGKILLLQFATTVSGSGSFSTPGYVSRLNADGSVDMSFTPYESKPGVHTLGIQKDGHIILAGSLLIPGSTVQYGLLRLQANGTIDNTFGVELGEGGYVDDIIRQEDGRLLLTGNFPAFQQSILCLQNNGNPDKTFIVSVPEGFSNTRRIFSTGNSLFVSYKDSRVIKLKGEKPLGVEESGNSLVHLYPNPATGQFNITLPQGWQMAEATLYDISGNAVPVSLHKDLDYYQVQTGNIPSGLYVLKVLTSQGTVTKRVILN